MYDLDIEIAAVTNNLKAEYLKALQTTNEYMMCASERQLAGFNGLLRMGMKNTDRATRICVVDIIAGQAIRECVGVLKVTSTKNIPAPMIAYLIDLFLEQDSSPWRLSEYGKWIISRAEEKAQVQLGQLGFFEMPNMS